jgi:hypothetical protein
VVAPIAIGSVADSLNVANAPVKVGSTSVLFRA